MNCVDFSSEMDGRKSGDLRSVLRSLTESVSAHIYLLKLQSKNSSNPSIFLCILLIFDGVELLRSSEKHKAGQPPGYQTG